MTASTQADLILANVSKDSRYAPYCLGCSTMERMDKQAAHLWKCRLCGAVCDLRGAAMAKADAAPKPEPKAEPVAAQKSEPVKSYSGKPKAERMALATRIEATIASRDAANLWRVYKGTTREQYVAVLKLVRGGVDLSTPAIQEVKSDLPNI